jgi:hypothetical protein
MTEITLKVADGIVGKSFDAALEAARKFFAGVLGIALGTLDPMTDREVLETAYGGRWKYFSVGYAESAGLRAILGKNQRVAADLTDEGSSILLTFRFEEPFNGYRILRASFRKDDTTGWAQWE